MQTAKNHLNQVQGNLPVKTRRTVNRFDAGARERFENQIVELARQGVTKAGMPGALRQMGVTGPNGAALDNGTVYRYWRALHARGRLGAYAPPPPSPKAARAEPAKATAPMAIAGILTDTALSAEQKINMLLAYYGL